MAEMNKVTEELLRAVTDWVSGDFDGAAYNIREDGGCAGRHSTENIKIEPKENGTGIDIYIAPGTKSEKVYIPACVTKELSPAAAFTATEKGKPFTTAYTDFSSKRAHTCSTRKST